MHTPQHTPWLALPCLACGCCLLLCPQLSASLGQLTKLEMPKAAGVTFQGVLSGFPALRRLDLSRCDQLNSAALPVALESFECLESVSLDNCTLTTLKLSMSQLKVGPAGLHASIRCIKSCTGVQALSGLCYSVECKGGPEHAHLAGMCGSGLEHLPYPW